MSSHEHFVSLFSNKSAPFDVSKLATILDASYTNEMTERKFIQKKSFAPSSLFWGSGECARRWFLAFNGAEFVKEPDSYSADIMRSGSDAHKRIQDNFEASGLHVKIEEELIFEDPPIRCFVDASFIEFEGRRIVVEIKTTRAEAFAHLVANNKGRRYQELQLLIYMYILGEQYGALMYECKNSHRKTIFPVEMTEDNLAEVESILGWMRKVYKNYQDGNLPVINYRKNSKICGGCDIKEYCFKQPDGVISIPALDYDGKK